MHEYATYSMKKLFDLIISVEPLRISLFSRHLWSQTPGFAACGSNHAYRVSLQCPYLFAAICELIILLLGWLAELLQATVRFVMPCLSVRTKQLSSQKTDFHSISYLIIFRKLVEKRLFQITNLMHNSFILQ